MDNAWNKLDAGLSRIYQDYLRLQALGPDKGAPFHPIVAQNKRFQVLMIYTGDLPTIEGKGFRTIKVGHSGRATGSLTLSELEEVGKLPSVLRLLVGNTPTTSLDVSVPDIGADQVWQGNQGTTGYTGEGVIVGVIDTGIDFQHPFFHATTAPPTTRILRIWDQGLEPQADNSEHSPDVQLLEGGAGSTYGVEYTADVINEVLSTAVPQGRIRHRDFIGHGTSVASIAAGNGGGRNIYIGVAPKANIIMVKYYGLENEPSTPDHGVVSEIQRYKDAVMYILNTSKHLNCPVVINCSLGFTGPCDGFTEREEFLTREFPGKASQAFVASAGNKAGKSSNGWIDFTQAGETYELEMILSDGKTNKQGNDDPDTRSGNIEIRFYYPTGGSTFSAKLIEFAGKPVDIQGPALNEPPTTAKVDPHPHEILLKHKTETVLLMDNRGNADHNSFIICIGEYLGRQLEGTYKVQVKSNGTLKVHVWVDQNNEDVLIWPATGISVMDDKHQIKSPSGSEGVICVAAYEVNAPNQAVSKTSSRGPLANYGVGPPQRAKPDIAAPGSSGPPTLGIVAALSSDVGDPFETLAFRGTSAATPHVAGAIALLFQKDPSLDTDQILEILWDTARPLVPPDNAEAGGAGRLDVLAAIDRLP